MPITLDPEILDLETVKSFLVNEEVNNCMSGYSHCYGSDGGTGIPINMKVPVGRGGNLGVWELNGAKSKVLNKFVYSKCQYCGKYIYAGKQE